MSDTMRRVQLNKEGANTLREFAGSMYQAMQNIMDDSEHLYRIYQSLEDDLGDHADSFEAMLNCIMNAKEDATVPIINLQRKLYELADKIDEYVDQKPEIS